MLDARGAVDLMKGDGAGSSVRGMVGLSWRKRKRSEFKETAPRGTWELHRPLIHVHYDNMYETTVQWYVCVVLLHTVLHPID
jgi:hypothetical protein